jgi:dUTPase
MSYIDATEAPPSHAILYLSVSDPLLHYKYQPAIVQHNLDVLNNDYPNSGVDLFFPENTKITNVAPTSMVSMGVRSEMRMYNSFLNEWKTTGYYMYPRSSISKTPLMLANNTGIIDSGYRGELIGAFRNLSGEPYDVEQHTRLLQICAPDLRPIVVKLVKESFFEETSRQSGGFGSTGL